MAVWEDSLFLCLKNTLPRNPFNWKFALSLHSQKKPISSKKHEEYRNHRKYDPFSPLEQKSLRRICQHRPMRHYRLPAQKRSGQFTVKAEENGNCRSCGMRRRKYLERNHPKQGDGYRHPIRERRGSCQRDYGTGNKPAGTVSGTGYLRLCKYGQAGNIHFRNKKYDRHGLPESCSSHDAPHGLRQSVPLFYPPIL